MEADVEYVLSLKVVIHRQASRTPDLRLLKEVGEVLLLPQWADRDSRSLLTASQEIVVAIVMCARALLSVERGLKEAVSLRWSLRL